MNLQPVLKHRLLHFEAATSVFLDINGRETLGIGSLIQHSAVLCDPLAGPLFEFKSVLQDSARTSEDVGQQLSYLRTTFVATTRNCAAVDQTGATARSMRRHDKTCTPLAKSGPVFSTGRKNSIVVPEYIDTQWFSRVPPGGSLAFKLQMIVVPCRCGGVP